jgi:ATP-binding cassette subfamily G (WHITE) protein 2 (SNQ2)
VFYFVNALLDLPLCVLEATILSAIIFLWVTTLQRGADCYFYLWAILVALEMVGQAMGRVVSLLSPTQIMATMVSTLTVLVWGSLSGYMPSYPGLPAWLKWANWLTPTAYGYEGLVLNNFVGLNISGVAIPTNGSGTLELGSVPGQTFLRALGQPRSGWGSPAQIMAFDLCMLFLFALLLDSVGVLVAELSRRKFSDLTRRRRQTVRAKAAHEAAETLPAASGAPAAARPRTAQLAVRDLAYAVHVAGDSVLDPRSCFRCLVGTRERRVLLRSVDASFGSGRMTALMGTSGAGKTTLMDVIAGMKTGGSVEGRVLIDGRAKEERTWRRISAYGEQNDILDPYLSVWETLVFTARCCDATRSLRDTEAFVRSVLARLSLSSVAPVMVGKEGAAEGLAKHQRKRLTIAIALCQEPSILFLDEPTSGLALLEAGSVMRAVRDITTELGLVTLVTIHQPGATFALFDDLLLLARGGRVAYAGPVGARGADALAYFGLPLDTPGDVSDRLLQAIDAAPDAAADAYAGSKLRADCLAAIQAAEDAALVDPPRAAPHPGAGFTTQVYLLTRRQFVMILRDPTIGILRLVVALLIAVYLGLVFYQIEQSIGGAVYLIAALFFFVQTSVIAMNGAVVPIVHGRAVLFRETRSGTYTKLARGVANFWAMLPFHAVCIVPASIILFYMCGFERWGGSLGLYVCLIFLGGWTILAIGELYAYSTPVEEAATGVAGLTLLLSVCFMGFLVTIRSFPQFWVWANTANLFRYQVQGLTTNALAGTVLPLLPPGTNLSSGQVPAFVPNNTVAVIDFAKQVMDNLPGNRSFFPESPPIVDYVNCLMANDCISQPYAVNIPLCSGIPVCIPRVSRCCKEFQAVNLTAILQIAACIPGGPLNINNLTESEKLKAVWCVMGVILPSAWLPWIKMLANWLVNGIPGDVLLIYFGWTGDISFPLVDGGTMRQLTATTYTWYYPFLAVAMFLLGVELLKLVAIHIEWIKR